MWGNVHTISGHDSRRWEDTNKVALRDPRASTEVVERGSSQGELTLRDGPIWWHYQSVSGHPQDMHAAGDATSSENIPHLENRLLLDLPRKRVRPMTY